MFMKISPHHHPGGNQIAVIIKSTNAPQVLEEEINISNKITEEITKSHSTKNSMSFSHATQKEKTINYVSTNKFLLEEDIIETTELKITETPLSEKAEILEQQNEINLT